MKDRRIPRPLQQKILDYYSNYFQYVSFHCAFVLRVLVLRCVVRQSAWKPEETVHPPVCIRFCERECVCVPV